jgi:peptidoglycan/xylan/chitin deacetylase (PgdA/CDA1 family)
MTTAASGGSWACRRSRILGQVLGYDDSQGAPLDVLVLAYHAVSDGWDAVTTVTPDCFRWQLEHLLERGYVGTTFDAALTTPPPGRVFAVTFDDAHRSVLDVAAPLLAERGVPATVFAPTDYVGTGEPTAWEGFEQYARGPHRDELVCLDWDELRGLADSGWEVGSHTCSHPRLTRLSDAALRDELTRSRALIEERLGRPCPSLAYPYSDVDSRVVAATAAAGYRQACTIPVGGSISLPLRWPRVGVFRTDSRRRFSLLTAFSTRTVLQSRSGRALADVVRGAKSRLR